LIFCNVSQGWADIVRRAGHAVKGAAANLMCHELNHAAVLIEARAKSVQDGGNGMVIYIYRERERERGQKKNPHRHAINIFVTVFLSVSVTVFIFSSVCKPFVSICRV
jgi:hypothetical protein